MNCPTVPPESSAAVTVAVRLVEELNVEVSAVPFHRTAELEMKPEPAMVTGVSGEPAGAEDGVTEMADGTGLESGGGGLGEALEPPPQPDRKGVRHKTDARRTDAIRAIGLLWKVRLLVRCGNRTQYYAFCRALQAICYFAGRWRKDYGAESRPRHTKLEVGKAKAKADSSAAPRNDNSAFAEGAGSGWWRAGCRVDFYLSY